MVRSFVLLFFSMLLNAAAQTPCEGLKTLALPGATITTAESIPAGFKELPAAPGAPKLSVILPAYCRIAAVLKPSSDSEIQMEIWLPAGTTTAAAALKTLRISSAKNRNDLECGSSLPLCN